MANTIEMVVTLPSKGRIYDPVINPEIKLRAMTTRDDMLRCSRSANKYKALADWVEGCIVGEKPAISVYDMCLGDVYYLIHQLRMLTFGSKYKLNVYCDYDQQVFETTVDLSTLEVKEWKDSLLDLFEVTLPISKKVVSLTYQTPRMMDSIENKAQKVVSRSKEIEEESARDVQTLMHSILTLDGQKMNYLENDLLVQDMHLADYNYLIQKVEVLNEAIGPSKVIVCECPKCHQQILSLFRYTGEFFRPSID